MAQAASPVRLAVDAGYGGAFRPGQPLPVRVQVAADRLVHGSVIVRSPLGSVAVPVEVVGGSSKSVTLVAPTSTSDAQVVLGVDFVAGGRQLVTQPAAVTAQEDLEVVGLLPGVLGGQPVPGPAPLSVDAGTARFVALDDQALAAAPGSLGPLAAVAAGPDDVIRLPATRRQTLLAWTAGGGRLLIDATAGATIAGLPPGWSKTGATRVLVGRGEVVFTNGAMGGGRWAGLVDPAPRGVSIIGPTGPFSGSAAEALAQDAGVHPLGLPWLLGFLVVYVLVVGPISFWLFRRRRQAELLWVVVPLVAFGFTAASYLAGANARSRVRLAQETIIDTSAQGGTVHTSVGLLARGETRARIQAPSGWLLSPLRDPSFAASGRSTGFAVTTGDQQIDGALDLSAGQFAAVSATGPSRLQGQLLVTATSAKAGEAQGTLQNSTGLTLQNVVVLVGGGGTSVGTLAPGATAHWTVSTAAFAAFQGPNPEDQLWGTPNGDGGGSVSCQAVPVPSPGGGGGPGFAKACTSGAALSTVVSGALWHSADNPVGPSFREPGTAVAVGWAPSYRSDVLIVGQGRPADGHTAVVGSAPVLADGSAVGDQAIRRQVVRGGSLGGQFGPQVGFGPQPVNQSIVVRFVLPPGLDSKHLVLHIPGGAAGGDLEVAVRGAWRRVTVIAGSSSSSSDGPSAGGPVGQGQVCQSLPPGPPPAPFVTATTAPPLTASPATIAPGVTVLPAPPTIPVPFGGTACAPVPSGPPGVASVPVEAVRDGEVWVRSGGGLSRQLAGLMLGPLS